MHPFKERLVGEGRMLGRSAGLAIVMAAFIAGPAPAAPADWRGVATRADLQRLSRLENAWDQALDDARRGGRAGEMRGFGALLDPAAALPGPPPAPGLYRCRTVKVGSQGGVTPALIAYGAFRCRIGPNRDGTLRLEKVTGSQRQVGTLFPDQAGRRVFLGSLALGSEGAAPRYGSDPERDQAGILERIGPRRYRLVFPYPQTESLLDVMELTAP